MKTRPTRFLVLTMLASLSLTLPARAGGGDFNGDGYDDLAIGSCNEDVDGVWNAGVVHIIYGFNAFGLNALNHQRWTQDSPGIDDECESGDYFGASLVIGDFDDDGYDDLAIGTSVESVNGEANAGSVHVLYGTATGLDSERSMQITQDTDGVPTVAAAGERFGTALCVGDYNGDRYADLAVGAFGEHVNGFSYAGAVFVFYGTADGLRTTQSQFFTQNTVGLLDQSEQGDGFGYTLAAGDFNNDGRDDLAIGAPSEYIGSLKIAGMVQVLYGGGGGLTTTDQLWTQNSNGIADVSEKCDRFGESLAVGDFNRDGFDDLAIGAPGETLGVSKEAGAVHVLYGSSLRLRSLHSQFWTQSQANVGNPVQSLEQFGSRLASGDFNRDGRDDLVISVMEKIGTQVKAGGVHILRGSVNRLTHVGAQYWSQNSAGIPSTAQTNDRFGYDVATGDFNRDGRDDLAIAAPGETILGRVHCGAVHVLYGTAGGVTAAGNQFWSQNEIGGAIEPFEFFGLSLGTGR